MIKNILSQDYYNDPVSQKLIKILERNIGDLENIIVFYQYPIIRELDEDLKYPSVLLVSQYHGVILFKCDGILKQRNGDELFLLDDNLKRIEDIIYSKLYKSPNKKFKGLDRKLSFNFLSVLYLPNLQEEVNQGDFQCIVQKDNTDLNDFLNKNKVNKLDDDVLKEILAIIEGSTAIVKPKERKVEKGDTTTKAYILKKLEEEIAYFDEQQKYAALSQLDGPQRIRGLAGSGKTIILCMKAALLHLKYPEKKILYTFTTKSLYDYIELLITRFYKVLGDGSLPDFDNSIFILHSWGGDNLKGVYYDCCSRNNISPISFKNAEFAVGKKEAFNYICKHLLETTKGMLDKEYDYVLMDEAQDFKPPFYQICRAIVKNDCIVWCYDELQNIFEVNMQDTKTTFENQYGYKGINLEDLQKHHPDMENDIVLSKCYRNPREILVTAHAIGFGIYNDKLIQSLENKLHWNDLGYEVVKGNCKTGDLMEIRRPTRNSPLSISTYQSDKDIIIKKSLNNLPEEVEWVCNLIEESIKKDGLRADDIIVISLDDRNSKTYFEYITDNLADKEIDTYNLSNNFYQKGFIKEKCVTLSTVYKAKGNEAAMVFVVGCDVFEYNKNDRSLRNRVFTAFTRAKAWLRISGINIENGFLFSELEDVRINNYDLKFIHKESHIIQRDLAEVNAKKSRARELYLEYVSKLKKEGYSEEEIASIMKSNNFDGSDSNE